MLDAHRVPWLRDGLVEAARILEPRLRLGLQLLRAGFMGLLAARLDPLVRHQTFPAIIGQVRGQQRLRVAVDQLGLHRVYCRLGYPKGWRSQPLMYKQRRSRCLSAIYRVIFSIENDPEGFRT